MIDASRLAWVAALAAAMGIGCSDDASGGGGSGAQAQGGEAEGGSPATGGSSDGGAAAGGAPEGGAAEGGATQGGGGQGGAAAGHCDGAVHCNSVDGYFCDEITGPSKAFEEACAAESGTFGPGPCNDENFGSACLFDCVTPSEYSIIGIDQVACEEAGGTYVQSL